MQKRKAVVAATLGATLIGSMGLMLDNYFNTKDNQVQSNYNIHKINNIYNQAVFNNNFRSNVNKAIYNSKPLTKAEIQYIKQLATKTQINQGDLIAIAKIDNKPIHNIKSKKLNENTKANKKVVRVQNTQYKWLDILLTHEQQQWIFDICKRNGIDPYLVFAIIIEESQCQNKSPNEYLCTGYMQINPVTADDTIEWLQKNDYKQYTEVINGFSLMDFKSNVHVGICTLKKLFIKYGDDPFLPLLKYGCGTGGADVFIRKHGYVQPDFMRKWFSYQLQLIKYGKIINEKIR